MGQVTSEGGQVKRTKAGLERARRQGKRIGRPRVSVDMAKAVALRGEGKSIREIALKLGIGAATLHRALGERLRDNSQLIGRSWAAPSPWSCCRVTGSRYSQSRRCRC